MQFFIYTRDLWKLRLYSSKLFALPIALPEPREITSTTGPRTLPFVDKDLGLSVLDAILWWSAEENCEKWNWLCGWDEEQTRGYDWVKYKQLWEAGNAFKTMKRMIFVEKLDSLYIDWGYVPYHLQRNSTSISKQFVFIQKPPRDVNDGLWLWLFWWNVSVLKARWFQSILGR